MNLGQSQLYACLGRRDRDRLISRSGCARAAHASGSGTNPRKARLRPSNYSILALGVLPFAMGLLACQKTATQPEAAKIEILSGGGQVGAEASALPQPVVVRVLDANGKPLRGAATQWRVVAGGGSIGEADEQTNADGQAAAEWILGVDVENRLYVAAAGASVLITARSEVRLASVAAGREHTCGLSTTGETYCWGNNTGGQLGDGTTISRDAPARVLTAVRFVQLAAGNAFTCGIGANGSAYCWGDDSDGQLGVGGTFMQLRPALVGGSLTFVSLTGGFVHSCGVTIDGEAYCWGSNARRQLGTTSVEKTNLPVRVGSSQKFRQISAGEFHTCAVSTDDRVYCWGWNSTGELGTGAPFGVIVATPTRVAGDLTFTAVSAGIRHTCGISKPDGTVHCWGRNGRGEIGKPPFQHSATPVLVPMSGPFTQLSAKGDTHSCGISAAGVLCWGSDGISDWSQPAVVLPGAAQGLDIGFNHACAVQNGEVLCWGSNNRGQLGVSNMASTGTPVKARKP